MAEPINMNHAKLEHPNLEISIPPTNASPMGSPFAGRHYYQLPSPIITKRTRTFSASEAALSNPELTGKVKYFCRQKGHGFITRDDGGDDIFFHISDIDGEIAPKHDDTVSFRTCLIPPKKEKLQATHVVITSLAPGSHERWDYPPSPMNEQPPPLSPFGKRDSLLPPDT